jgi:flavin reductase (DIM6/NTAB) family NADH-FMN oxidoreductase RutF
MIVEPQSLSPSAMYRFMIGIVVPRPIAFVSTVGKGGALNVAPFSYFNAITNRPPLIGISVTQRAGEPKDTLRNIQETGDFVVNVVNESMLERVVQASGDWPRGVDEFQLTGFTPVKSDLVQSPRVAESPASLECRLFRVIELGDSYFTVGEIVRVHVADEVMTDGRVDVAKLRPAGRLGGDGYTIVRDVIQYARPRVGLPSDGGGA